MDDGGGAMSDAFDRRCAGFMDGGDPFADMGRVYNTALENMLGFKKACCCCNGCEGEICWLACGT